MEEERTLVAISVRGWPHFCGCDDGTVRMSSGGAEWQQSQPVTGTKAPKE